MNRKQALEHFKAGPLKEKQIEKRGQLRDYFNMRKDKLIPDFVESFRRICIKIAEMQARGEKDKIGYITYSAMASNIADRNYIYVIDAYNVEWFFDEVECRDSYDVSWAFRFLDEFEAELEPQRKLYMDKITKADMEQFRLEGFGIYNAVIKDFIRYAMPYAVKIEEYKQIEKADVFEVRAGPYKGASELMYKEDRRIKNSSEIKVWLESKEEIYDYEILKDLDLANGDYEGIGVRYGDFSRSNLENCNLKKCNFIGTKFIESSLLGTDLEDSAIDRADFTKSDLKNANMKGVKGLYTKFENTDMENVILTQAELVDANMKKANLKNSIFTEALIIGVCFDGANLENCNFEGADLTQSDMRGAVLKGINLKNALLDNTKFFKKDLALLNLDTEQRAAIILEE